MKFAKTLAVLVVLAVLVTPSVSAAEIPLDSTGIMVDYWGTVDINEYLAGCSSFIDDAKAELVFER